MTIGKATNYERSNRSSAIHLSNAYLSVKNNIPNVRFYTVNVHYANLRDGKDYKYLTEQRSGKIYVNPLPGDVDATLTISPNSTAYKAEKPYTISNKQLLNAIFSIRDEKGSYASYDFKLAKTGKEDKALPLFRGVEPRYAYEGDLNTEARIKISEDGREGGNAAIFMVLVVIILGVVIYLVIRKKKK